MNAKELKFMQLFEEFSKTEIIDNPSSSVSFIKKFIALDFLDGVKIWDYLSTTRESAMSQDAALAKILGDTLFNVFYSKNQAKTIKAMNDNISIRRAMFQYSPATLSGDDFIVLTDLMVSNKIEACDEILKCLIKNEHISFGDIMKRCLERVFIELLKKNPAKIDMSKKLSALLLTYVKRIKTDERAMLEQRLREIQ